MRDEYATRKFTEAEFEKLQPVDYEALLQNKPIVTRTGNAAWYRLFDTPDGIYMAVKVVDTCGIQDTSVFNIKYVHHWFKLAPEVDV